MSRFLTVLSSSSNKIRQLIVKTYNGAQESRTGKQIAPAGLDSNPVKDMVAVWETSGLNGKDVIIGYIHKDVLAKPGEIRLFSTDSSGVFKTNIWLGEDGIIYFGDSNEKTSFTDFLTKFNEMKQGFDQLKADHNSLVQKWNAFCGTYVPGSPTTVGLPPTLSTSTATASTASIDNAKAEKLKTK